MNKKTIKYISIFLIVLIFAVVFLYIAKQDSGSENVRKSIENSSYYSKDKERVYLGDQGIAGADSESFVIIEHPYAKDENNVYFMATKIEEADKDTFAFLASGTRGEGYIYFAKDKNYFYENGKQVAPVSEDFYSGYDNNCCYFKFGNEIFGYNGDYDGTYTKMPTVDAPTFFPFFVEGKSVPVAKDKNYVFSNNQIIPDANPLSYSLLPFLDIGSTGYGKDDSNVFCITDKVQNANPKTFNVIQIPETDKRIFFGKDGQKLFFEEKELVGIDADTVEVLNGGAVIRDADTAWYLKGDCHDTYGEYVTEEEILPEQRPTWRIPC